MTSASSSPLSPNLFLRAGMDLSARVVKRGSSRETALERRERLCLMSAGGSLSRLVS